MLEALAESALTLQQLVDRLKEDDRWRRVDPRLVKNNLQKLEDSFAVLHEREGSATRYRWFSSKDAQIIGERNERRRKLRTTRAVMLIREALATTLQAESLILVKVIPGGIAPLTQDGEAEAHTLLAQRIAANLELAPATRSKSNP